MNKLTGTILTLPKMSGNVGAKTINIGGKGDDGATFTPSVSADGIISWTNDKGLPNPEPVNIKGTKGDKGDKGDRGLQGVQGIQGERGEQGQKGDKGDRGEQGIQGVQGVKGETGATGAKGADGTPATHRWSGTTLYITSASGTSSADLKGEKGEQGDSGKTPVKGEDYYTEADKAEIVEEVKESGVLVYTEQTLTEAQKAQARENIGAGDEWFQIADVTTTEEVAEIVVTTNIPCKKLIAHVVFPSSISGSDWFGACTGMWLGPMMGNNITGDATYRLYEITLISKGVVMLEASYNVNKYFWGDLDNTKILRTDHDISSLDAFYVSTGDGLTVLYPVGTSVKVWGLKK